MQRKKKKLVSLSPFPFQDIVHDTCEELVLFIADACTWREVFHLHLIKPWFVQYFKSTSEERFNSVDCGTLKSSLRVYFQWMRRFKSKPFRSKVKWSPSKLYSMNLIYIHLQMWKDCFPIPPEP